MFSTNDQEPDNLIESTEVDSSSEYSSGELWNSNPGGNLHIANVNNAMQRGKDVLEKLDIELSPSRFFTRPTSAPWERVAISTDKSIWTASKNGASTSELRSRFFARKNTKYRLYTDIYTDGSKTEERVGYSIVNGVNVTQRRINDNSSIFRAESLAVKDAVEWITQQQTVGAYLICTDSLSVIKALENRKISSVWRDEIGNLYKQAIGNGTTVTFLWIPGHAGIAGNERADREAKRAIEDSSLHITELDIKDMKNHIKNKSLAEWNSKWHSTSGNHLREVKNSVLPYKASFTGRRKDDVTLARLRIGHTKLTHSYLLEKKDPPVCTWCNDRLSIKHLIENCPGTENARKTSGVPCNLREALADDQPSATNILKFLELLNLDKSI